MGHDGSTNTGVDGMVVVVTPCAWQARGRAEAVEILQFLGYTVLQGEARAPFGMPARYVIDTKHPNWFGWKGALAAITVLHYPDMQEWHRRKSLEKSFPAMTSDLTNPESCDILEADSCFT